MSNPVRYPFGVSTARKTNPLGMYGLPDPTQWHTYWDDFDAWVTTTSSAAKYTITTTEVAGTATEAIGDENGSTLVITNGTADNDCDWFQKLGESFLLTSGKRTIFKARFKLSDATECDWIMGLQITDTTPLAAGGDGVTDGIFFQKDDGDTDIDFYVQKNSTTGQLTSTAVTTAAAADTYMTLAFAFDGNRYVAVYKDDVQVANVDLTATLTTYLPDTEITVSFGIQNGEAVAKVMTIDYIFAAQER